MAQAAAPPPTTAAKKEQKKVLLMGKSGAGKSSMRNIIFSNYVAKDVRRLGATIDVETSKVKFLSNLYLHLWDCGGQESFMAGYKSDAQKQYTFSGVGVLIYVFDVESRDPMADFKQYQDIVKVLSEFSPHAIVFCLVHKMDLVQLDYRERIFLERERHIRDHSHTYASCVACHATTIWDESLYRAWGKIVRKLVPDVDAIQDYLERLAESIDAEEVVLFERTTFLTVTSVQTERGQRNPNLDRHERLSNIIKTFKHSMAVFTSSSSSSNQFDEFFTCTPRFNYLISRLTNNTFVLAVLPPGEAALNCTRINVATAREEFAGFDTPVERRTGMWASSASGSAVGEDKSAREL